MSKWSCMATLVALTLSIPTSLSAHDAHAHAEAPDITVKGEILDLACYIGHGAKGSEHQQCALKCAQMGQPLGLLTTDGKLYLLTADHQDPTAFRKAKQLAGDQVEMTGAPAERDGVTALTVHAVKK
ncbi:MAG TPA: hypothetical protein VFW45_12075 [Candidatus Polarisedimenticolia bacterium]|nr:hypothetical protein [Candidatus Polarisedimenticolia bacterium]